jgi:hypothetical protein
MNLTELDIYEILDNSQLMEESFGVFSKKESEGLDEDESVEEFVALSDLQFGEVLGIHEFNERSDQFWD